MKRLVLNLLMLSLPMFAAASSGDDTKIGAYMMPYLRYDSAEAQMSGGATQIRSLDYDIAETACEASNQEYVELSKVGAALSWEVTRPANGLTIRFTLPDNSEGSGTTSLLDIEINGKRISQLPLTSFWSYQYFAVKGLPDYVPAENCPVFMRFDETHTLLPKELQVGDKITLRLRKGAVTGIDFAELESVGAPLSKPEDALSVEEFGAVSGDDKDDLAAFDECIEVAHANGKKVYIPAGHFTLSERLDLKLDNTHIVGAGIWYTNIFFSNNNHGGGGIRADAKGLYLGHIYCNTINSTRMDGRRHRGYHCIAGTWEDSVIEYLWEDHFTVGAWLSANRERVETDNLHLSHVRFRNNYADGINFAHGSSSCTIEHSDIRNCGDDGLASWSSNSEGKSRVRRNHNNTFRWCTVEYIWRASGIGIFGGEGHKIHNILISECVSSSGIRLTSNFPGYHFATEYPMEVWDCVVNKCGSRQTLFGTTYGAVQLTSRWFRVNDIKISNIDIIDSYTDAVRIALEAHDITNVELSNINIKRTGIDGRTGGRDNPAGHRGAGVYIYAYDEAMPSDVTLRDINYEDCPDGEIVNNYEAFKIKR